MDPVLVGWSIVAAAMAVASVMGLKAWRREREKRQLMERLGECEKLLKFYRAALGSPKPSAQVEAEGGDE